MRKGELEELSKYKIKIGCRENIAYQDVAYLVDKPSFLRLLPKYRKRYSIKRLLPLKSYKKWWIKTLTEDLRKILDKNEYFKSIEKTLEEYKKTGNKQEYFKKLPFHERFDFETKLLTRTFKRPGYFHLIIKHCIVCGEVNKSSWQPTYADVIPWELPTSEFIMPEVAVILSPMSKDKDVLRAFRKAKSLFKENRENLKYLPKMKKVETDNIRRDRRWYWKSVKGKGAGDIYEEEFCGENPIYDVKKNESLDRNLESIDKAIDRYKKILQNF